MATTPAPNCISLTKLPNDMLFVILEKCLAEDNGSFYTLSASCKEFHGLLHDKTILRTLHVEWTPAAVLAVTDDCCSFLRKATKAGNQHAGYLLGLYLTFNGPEPTSESGIQHLKGMNTHFMWLSRYVHAMAILKVGSALEAAYALQRLFQDMGHSRSAMVECRSHFRLMLRPGKHTSLGTTNMCVFRGYGHWQFKSNDEITGSREFLIRCPFCAIDIETYKLKHALE